MHEIAVIYAKVGGMALVLCAIVCFIFAMYLLLLFLEIVKMYLCYKFEYETRLVALQVSLACNISIRRKQINLVGFSTVYQ